MGPVHPGLAELLVDDQLLERRGITPPRRGPVRHPIAGIGDAPVPFEPVPLAQLVEEGPDLPSMALGFGGQLDAEVPAHTAERQPSCRHPPTSWSAQQQAIGGRPLEIEVSVVFPGEADATEHLDAVLGAAICRLRRHRRGHAHGKGRARRLAILAGVPGGGPSLLQRAQHVGAAMLDPLELADGPAELLTHDRMLGGAIDAPRGDADALGREQHRRQAVHAGSARWAGQQPVPWHGDAASMQPGDPAGPVEGHDGLQLQLVRFDDGPLLR